MELQGLQGEFGQLHTQVLGATVQPLAITEPLARKLDITYPILVDPTHKVAEAFGIFNLPGGMGPLSTHSMFLIDKAGRIRWSQVSLEMYIQPKTIQQQVKQLASTGE